MSQEMLLGYACGIMTLAFLSRYPEKFKPTITENPRIYLLVGLGLGAVAVAMDFIEVWF